MVREVADKQPQNWRFCSNDTFSFFDMQRHNIKVDASAPDQWFLLDMK